jgi:hypothetical protein
VEAAPQPLDPSVQVREAPGGTFAVAAFSGYASAPEAEAEAAKLRAAVAADGLNVGGDWVLARYNDPSVLPPFRRNEVLVPLAGFQLPA